MYELVVLLQVLKKVNETILTSSFKEFCLSSDCSSVNVDRDSLIYSDVCFFVPALRSNHLRPAFFRHLKKKLTVVWRKNLMRAVSFQTSGSDAKTSSVERHVSSTAHAHASTVDQTSMFI